MLRVLSLKAQIGTYDQGEAETLISHLEKKGYESVIRNMFKKVFSSVNLTEPTRNQIRKIMLQNVPKHERSPQTIVDELFFKDGNLFTLENSSEMTIASMIGYEGEEDILDEFCKEVSNSVKINFDGRRIRGMEFEWRLFERKKQSPVEQRSFFNNLGVYKQFNKNSDKEMKFSIPDYSEEDIKMVKLLADKKIRSFVIELAKLKKVAKNDAEKTLSEGEILQKLLENDLMSKEFLITCKQNHHAICTVSSLEELKEKNSLKCSECGRQFLDEITSEIYAISEKSRKLINQSTWMSIWVTECLIKNGIRKDKIRWNLEGNGEELDIVVEDYNQKIFFELKDREFGLGDAYPFAFRVERYQGRMGVIATTDKVSTDAKKFLNEQQRPSYRFLEQNKGIENGLTVLVKELVSRDIKNHIGEISGIIGINFDSLIDSWIIQKIQMKNLSSSQIVQEIRLESRELSKLKDTTLQN